MPAHQLACEVYDIDTFPFQCEEVITTAMASRLFGPDNLEAWVNRSHLLVSLLRLIRTRFLLLSIIVHCSTLSQPSTVLKQNAALELSLILMRLDLKRNVLLVRN